MILRLLVKIALGVTLGSIIGNIVTGNFDFAWGWSIGFTAVMVLPVIAGIRGRRAAGIGALALARIETIQRTGLEETGMQPVEMLLTIAPEKGATYPGTLTMSLASEELRQYIAGTVLVVTRGPLGELTIVTAPDPVWAAKAESARRDPSLIPVASGTAPKAPPAARQAAPWEVALSIAIILGAAAVTLIPAYQSIGRGVTAIATGDWDAASMITGNYQQEAIDDIAAVAGSYQFTSINFYDSYVILEGLTAPGADTTDEYIWRYGKAVREGPSFIQPPELQAELFDASDLDFSMVATVVERSLAEVQLQGDVDIYPRVSRPFDGGAPVIYVSLSGDYKDASFTYNFGGEELERTGTAFD